MSDHHDELPKYHHHHYITNYHDKHQRKLHQHGDFHHHHGPTVNDILIHDNDECNNDNETSITIHYGFGSEYVVYGPAHHDHGTVNEHNTRNAEHIDDIKRSGYYLKLVNHPFDNDTDDGRGD